MNLTSLMEESGVRVALIVDDVYDDVPKAADLRGASDRWSIFFDDIGAEQLALITEKYPTYDDKGPDELAAEDEFVSVVWDLREQLGELVEGVLQEYLHTQETDRVYVETVETVLRAIGLDVRTCGREFAEAAREADLLIVDLFLGADQNSAMLAESTAQLAGVVALRVESPPLVILMSRSGRLSSQRDKFRDDAGLLESGFRILNKHDLAVDEGIYLQTQIERLALNSVETRRLATFFSALEEGILGAQDRTLRLMRKLKLSDIGQIQQLLLDFEGQPTGSYLVDVFDRVFQHELEGQLSIVDAAIELNKFSSIEHPPPYVSGSPELQELVQRMLSQHTHRLRLPASIEASVAFGDVLQLDLNNYPSPGTHPARGLEDGAVVLVITPACDLQRGAAPRVLLLAGTPEPVTAQNWSLRSGDRTPAIRLGDSLCWVHWDVQNVLTLTREDLNEVTGDKSLVVVARLREAHALQLQQRVLSGLGRVGLVSSMPATFTVAVEAYIADAAGSLRSLGVEALAEPAVCYIGRDKEGNRNVRLVLGETACDEIQGALSKVADEDVHALARIALKHIKESGDVQRALSKGLVLNGMADKTWVEIKRETVAEGGLRLGLVSWSKEVPTTLSNKELAKAGVVLVLRDHDGGTGLSEAATLGLL